MKDPKRIVVRKQNTVREAETKIFYFICGQMLIEEGVALNELAAKMAKKFKWTQKKSMNEIKKAIRKMRKKNMEILIRTRPNKADDLYAIEDD